MATFKAVGDAEFVQTIDMTEEEMIEKHQKTEKNKSNPNSCEREPNGDEIKLPVEEFIEKYELGLLGEGIGRKTWGNCIHAENLGYHYFVISKSDLNYLNQSYK